MIKIAQLANDLDKKSMFKEADQLDEMLPKIISFHKKFDKLSDENIQTFARNNSEFIKLAKDLESLLICMHTKESENLLEEIKTAGFGDFLGGLGEIVKVPFSSVGNYFRDLALGGKLKRSLDKSMKNLEHIRSLIVSGEEGEKQAQEIMSGDINDMLSVLKSAYGDLQLFDAQIDQESQDDTSTPESEPNNQTSSQKSSVSDPSMPNEDILKGILASINDHNTFMKKYAQNRGSLALINDLAQLDYAVKNTNNIQMAFNAWVKVLHALNSIQYDKKPEPSYRSSNPDINDPSRGGSFDPRSGVRENKPPVRVESIPKTFTENEALKRIANSVTFKGAVKTFQRFFKDRNFTDTEAEEIVEAARRRWNPKKIWQDSPFQITIQDSESGWY